MKTIRTILFPTDFSERSAVAWKHALLHAEKNEAKLVVVHVVHRMPKDYQFLIVAMMPAQIYEVLKERAEQKMARLAKEAKSHGVGCEVLIRDGQPFVQIIRCARESKGGHHRDGKSWAYRTCSGIDRKRDRKGCAQGSVLCFGCQTSDTKVSDAVTLFIRKKEVAMMNLYLKIKWSTALLLGILLILTGVVGMFIPLVPEIAVILLGMWLLGAAAVNPVGLWRLRQGEEQHRSTTHLHTLVVAAFLLTTMLYGPLHSA